MNLLGKRILITGAGSGIGLEAITQFEQLGAEVMICGRTASKLDAVVKKSPKVRAFVCDITKEEELKKMYNDIISIGGVDIIYNNAAVINKNLNLLSEDSPYHAAFAEIETNYLATIRLNNLFLPMLSKQREAAIINTSSVVAYLPLAIVPTYSATKAALHSYTISLRLQLEAKKSPVKVYELMPPLVNTAMADGFNAPKLSPDAVVKELIQGIQDDKFEIRVGRAGLLYRLSRFFPKKALKLLNPAKVFQLLK